MIIAIDGPAASGKGTLAKKLAKEFGLSYLDTGKLYRAVGVQALEQNIALDEEKALAILAKNLNLNEIDEEKLRSAEAGEAASKVSQWPKLRSALVEFQRHFALKGRGAILDGRDIGTVILPDADVKLFITASPEVRAQRRFKDFQNRGDNISYERVLADIKARDERDQNRAAAPLKIADNAHLIDTTNLGIEAAIEACREIILMKHSK